jgi:hypothetical protein
VGQLSLRFPAVVLLWILHAGIVSLVVVCLHRGRAIAGYLGRELWLSVCWAGCNGLKTGNAGRDRCSSCMGNPRGTRTRLPARRRRRRRKMPSPQRRPVKNSIDVTASASPSLDSVDHVLLRQLRCVSMGSGTQLPARYIHQCSPKTLNAELQVINKQYRLPDQHPYRL